MGKELRSLNVGNLIVARLVEQVTTQDFIVEYKGELVRVINSSSKQFAVGDQIKLRVVAIRPLRFQVDSKGFNYSVSV